MLAPTKTSRGGALAAEHRELVLAEDAAGGEPDQGARAASGDQPDPATASHRARRRDRGSEPPSRCSSGPISSRIERRLIAAHSRRLTHSAAGTGSPGSSPV